MPASPLAIYGGAALADRLDTILVIMLAASLVLTLWAPAANSNLVFNWCKRAEENYLFKHSRSRNTGESGWFLFVSAANRCNDSRPDANKNYRVAPGAGRVNGPLFFKHISDIFPRRKADILLLGRTDLVPQGSQWSGSSHHDLITSPSGPLCTLRHVHLYLYTSVSSDRTLSLQHCSDFWYNNTKNGHSMLLYSFREILNICAYPALM